MRKGVECNNFFGCGNPLTTRRNPNGNTHHFNSSDTRTQLRECVCALSMRYGRLPLLWRGRGTGGETGKGGKELLGNYRNGMTLSEITQTELKFPSQLIILFLSSFLSSRIQGEFSLSIRSRFLSFYLDDLCRRFRKCRLNVSVELGSLNLFFSPWIFTTLSDQ